MAIKVPGEKPASKTGTLLTNGMTVHPRWYEYKRNPPPAPTIDWQFYKSLFDMELWQALALSCGIIPDYPNEGQDAEYDRRMVIALNHMQPGALLADIKKNDRPHLTRVKLADVARLAAALDWSLPDAFPRLQPTESAPMANETTEPRQDTETLASNGHISRDTPPEWIGLAQEQAKAIIKDYKARDLYPNQITVADLIAKDFRASGIVGTDGKPPSGATIKRHALKGISSAIARQQSTAINWGKRGNK